MKDFFFTAEDFDHGFPEGPDPQNLADIANEKIEPLLQQMYELEVQNSILAEMLESNNVPIDWD